MNTIYRISCSILAILVIGCSSEDQEKSKKEVELGVWVLDQVIKENYTTEIAQEKLGTTLLARKEMETYVYDDVGRVSSIDIVESFDGMDSVDVQKKMLFTYNRNNQLITLKMMDTQKKEELIAKKMFYDTQGWINKVLDEKMNVVYLFGYSVGQWIIGIDWEYNQDKFSTVFSYKLDGNISSAGDYFSQNERIYFTYDANKTAYANMNIDLQHEEHEWICVLSPFKFVKGNIIGWYRKSREDGKTQEVRIEYDYNEEKLPIKQTVYEIGESHKIISIRHYAYKKMRVASRNLIAYRNGSE